MVLSQEEIARVLAHLDEAQRQQDGMPHGLMGRLLYGTGMRVTEGLRLRVKDIEFERRAIIVREGKGTKGPRRDAAPPRWSGRCGRNCWWRAPCWESDRACGLRGVQLPHALARKYPRAASSWNLVLGLSAAHAVARPARQRAAAASPA